MKYQPPPDPIDISIHWTLSPQYDGVFIKGARDKSLHFSPQECDDFLIPNHRYLFKEPWDRHPEQFWVEIIAYKVGCIVNIPVPPTFVATRRDPATNNYVCGALIEWFYDTESESFVEYYDAGIFLENFVEEFDRRRGEKHNLVDNFELLDYLNNMDEYEVDNSCFLHLFDILLFDSIIGNTDRHQDNWGLLLKKTQDQKLKYFMSPAYDNGTSMGYEILERNLENFTSENRRKTYINRGKHHMTLFLGDERRNHVDFIKSMLEYLPALKQRYRDFFSFNFDDIVKSIQELTHFNVPTPLSQERADFVINLLHDRIALLREVITNDG